MSMMGGMGAPLPPMDPSMGGMADPSMGMAGPPMSPSPHGAEELGEDPMGAPIGAPAGFPSTDPSVIAQIMQMLGGLQMQDQASLKGQQDAVLMQVLQAMGIGGAPTPDAGFAEGGDAMAMPEDVAMGY